MNFVCITGVQSLQLFEDLKWLCSIMMEDCIKDLLLIICSLAETSYENVGETSWALKSEAESQGHISHAQHVFFPPECAVCPCTRGDRIWAHVTNRFLSDDVLMLCKAVDGSSLLGHVWKCLLWSLSFLFSAI